MNSVSDLNMVKGREVQQQRALVDELTSRFGQTSAAAQAVLKQIPKDDLVDLSVESPNQAIRYALLAIIAADIATVPYQEGRAFHMQALEELASGYDLSVRKIVYLTQYAEQWISQLEAVERSLGIAPC